MSFFRKDAEFANLMAAVRDNIVYRILIFIFKALLVVFVVVYVGGQFLTSFSSIDELNGLIEDTTGADLGFLYSNEEDYEQPDVGVDEVDEYINEDFYNTYYIITILAAFAGTVVLSRMRSVYETLGLLLAFIIPRKRKSWGSIIDKENNHPVPLAVIRLYKDSGDKQAGRQILETVADLDGKYRVHVHDTAAEYTVEVHAPGFVDYRSKLRYFDDPLETGDFIADIYLVRAEKGKHRAEDTINTIRYLRPKLYWYLMLVMFGFSVVYFLFAIYYFWAFPGSVYGMINLGLYSFALFWNTIIVRERVEKPAGRVLQYITKNPMDSVFVQIYNKTNQLDQATTDKAGIVQFNLPAGKYSARFVKSGYKIADPDADKQMFVKVQIDEEGHFKEDHFLEMDKDKMKQGSERDLSNPFA